MDAINATFKSALGELSEFPGLLSLSRMHALIKKALICIRLHGLSRRPWKRHCCYVPGGGGRVGDGQLNG